MQKLAIVLGLLVVLGACHSFKENSAVKQLTVSDFSSVTGIGTGTITKNTLGMFYAPWCGHCKNLIPIFEQFAENAPEFNVIAVDCTENEKICNQFNVRGYPTLLYFTSDYKQIKYSRGRNVEAFIAFAKEDYKSQPAEDITFQPIATGPAAVVETLQETAQKIITKLAPVPVALSALGTAAILAVMIYFMCCRKKQEVSADKKQPEETPAPSKSEKKRD